jgi:uroporphyrinogen-III synthase
VQYRKRKVFFGETGKIADLMPMIQKHKTEKYFIPQSDVHSNELTDMLDARGITYSSGVMYRTVSNDFTSEEEFNYDMLVFFSPSGIQSLMKNFPNYNQGETAIATFGPATAKSVEEAGLRLDLQAPTPEFPSITAALDAYLKQHNG